MVGGMLAKKYFYSDSYQNKARPFIGGRVSGNLPACGRQIKPHNERLNLG